MKAFIENPANTKLKKEFEKGKWINRGSLSEKYPYPYGFIPDTLEEDGDPLDVFIITDKPMVRGYIVDIEILGCGIYVEDGKRDNKIIARINGTKNEFDSKNKSKIKFFLENAFRGKNKKVKFSGFFDKKQAIKLIKTTSL